ncbi:hypothetical protein D9758_017390 [Tetrapyrgos nigripes]|uniref:HAT C-terminal dimerisation domain-containing protein n=1 Tax=Tetrapyrgos nigripes TaxID=182062 RepID=A0A8H5C4Y8_9AGAR|nr:hypothetical protein D9758_017390 [Tetrapyrgos nigripes]
MLEGFVDDEAEELRQRIIPVTKMLVKLRKVSFKTINSSTLLLPQWFSILAEHKKKETVIPRDVKTCWNSTYDMLDYSCEHKRHINAFTSEDAENGLSEFALSKGEWKIAEQLCEVLSILKDATLYFSRSTPDLTTVIPSMDYINSEFEKIIVNVNFDPAIRAAVSLAKSEQKYSAASMRNLKLIVREEFELSYKREYRDEEVDEMQVDEDEVTETKTNHFDNLPSLAPPKTDSLRDELDRYLDGDPEATEDVIAWWYDKRKSFPCLYRMALDYLTIPDVKRIFSRGRLMLPYVCNRLKVQTTRSLMCLGPWSRLGMIHDDDVKAVVLLDEVPLEQGDEDGDIEMPEGWDSIDTDIII